MEDVRTVVSEHPTACKIAGGIVVVSVGFAVRRWLKRRRASQERKNYPPNTVILHQVGRGPFAPSMGPFIVKLETYLRMAKIPYQNLHNVKTKSKKNKVPWMTYNGEDIADSAFCIQYLNKCYDLDLSAWLTPEQRAVAVAFQRLVEEDVYWALVVARWVNEQNVEFLLKAFPFFGRMMLKYFIKPFVRRMTWAQGMGRHSPEEVKQITRKDLTALSDYLGNKMFLMGDKPCEEDCAVFGQLSQLYWHLPGTSIASLFKEFPRLVRYCERMKDTFWPDWVECTTQGGTVKATK